MEVLRQQAGAPFFEDTIHGFLNLFSVENIINDLLRETETSFVVIEKSEFYLRLNLRSLAVFVLIFTLFVRQISPNASIYGKRSFTFFQKIYWGYAINLL